MDMDNFLGALRYSFRQFRQSPIFAVAAVLTLSLGIGGTTAIFTLIHAVMLKSLPVSDPSSLYRIGDGDNCCVNGGPQDRWGLFSFPLFERLKAEAPEFEQVTAFQAGGARVSVRRQGVDTAARPLRSEYVAIGLLFGISLAIGAGKLLAAQLYGVTFWDPLALAVAAGSLALCALIAAMIPAGRAASIPPMRALRTD